jgi:4-hydroxy-tetrahydrodipicolinate synthase
MSTAIESCRERLRRGLIPAVPVPFNAAREIDAAAHAAYLAYMAAQPIAGVAVWAHTGRGLHLSRSQRVEVLRAWRKALARGAGTRKVIVAGVGGSPTSAGDFKAYLDSALAMAGDAIESGADALMIHAPAPARTAPGKDAMVLEYHQRLAALGTPLVLFYLYEAAGGISYSPLLIQRLLAIPEVIGIKVATLDSVMTFQWIARLCQAEFPQKLLITGEDRFLGYSLMCGAQAALIGMGAACTALQALLLDAWFERRGDEFLELSQKIDRLSQVLFTDPMEGYIRRMLWTLVHLKVISLDASHDPWGPGLNENQFLALGNALRAIGEVPAEAASATSQITKAGR